MAMFCRAGLLATTVAIAALAFGQAAVVQNTSKNQAVFLVDGQKIILSEVENIRRQAPAVRHRSPGAGAGIHEPQT